MTTKPPIEPQKESRAVANENVPPKPIEERFAAALSELIGMCMEAGMHTDAMIPAMEKELEWMRQPYENPKDGER